MYVRWESIRRGAIFFFEINFFAIIIFLLLITKGEFIFIDDDDYEYKKKY